MLARMEDAQDMEGESLSAGFAPLGTWPVRGHVRGHPDLRKVRNNLYRVVVVWGRALVQSAHLGCLERQVGLGNLWKTCTRLAQFRQTDGDELGL